MVFNATFNNISVISLRSVLLLEETGENHRHFASHEQTLSHNVVSSTPCLRGIRIVMGNGCMCSCKSNYHTNTTMMAPLFLFVFLVQLNIFNVNFASLVFPNRFISAIACQAVFNLFKHLSVFVYAQNESQLCNILFINTSLTELFYCWQTDVFL